MSRHEILLQIYPFISGNHSKRPASQNKRIAVLEIAFQAKRVFWTFEKQSQEMVSEMTFWSITVQYSTTQETNKNMIDQEIIHASLQWFQFQPKVICQYGESNNITEFNFDILISIYIVEFNFWTPMSVCLFQNLISNTITSVYGTLQQIQRVLGFKANK